MAPASSAISEDETSNNWANRHSHIAEKNTVTLGGRGQNSDSKPDIGGKNRAGQNLPR